MSALPGWPGNRDGFCPVFIWEISSRLPRWKHVQRSIKIPAKSPRSLKTLRTSVSAKFKSVISKQTGGATYSSFVRTLSVVSYRCYVATAEWLSSAVQYTTGKAQSCNPASLPYCESEPIFFVIRNWISLVLVTGLECFCGKDFQHGCWDPDNRAIWTHRKFYEGKSGEAKPSQFGWPAHMKRL